MRSLDHQLATRAHRIACVDGQVDDDLLELTAIGMNGFEVGRKDRVEPDVFADETPQQLANVADDGVQVDGDCFDRFTSAEGEQLPGQGDCPIRGSPYLVEV